MRFKRIFIVLFFVLVLAYAKESYCSSVYLTSNASNVNVGDVFNVGIVVSGMNAATLTTRITVDTGKLEYISGPDNSNFSNGRAIYSWTDATGGENPITSGTIATFTFRAISNGTANFGVSGEFFDSDEEEIDVSYSGTSVNVSEPTAIDESPDDEIVDSQGINEQDNQEITDENIYYEEPNEQVDDYSHDNTSKIDVFNDEIKASASNNTFLRTLQLDVVGINPSFNKNVENYYITIPTTINSINVTAEPEDDNSNIIISGNNNLINGSNYIYIKVLAENGNDSRVYTINVVRTDDNETNNANLESLAIENISINPEFDENITEYTAVVEKDVEKVNILAIPKVEEANVKIEGNEKLIFGENIIRITVTSINKESSKVYTIKLNKTNLNQTIDTTSSNDMTEANSKRENEIKRNTIFIVIGVIVVVIIIGILVYKNFIVNNIMIRK